MDSMAIKRERHRRFWQPLERGEGGYLGVTAPLADNAEPVYKLELPKDVEEKWLSVPYRLRLAESHAQNTFWGQDAIQAEFVNFGPGVHAALVGAPYRLTERSVWFDLEPPIKQWTPMPVLKTDTDHLLYRTIMEHTKALCEASRDRYLVSYTDIGGQMDVLFSLRGEDLLMDFIDAPEAVLAAQDQLDTAFLDYFDTLTKVIEPTGQGFTGWIPLASDVPWYPIQCDLSVMISPAMFERFVLPSLARIAGSIGRAVYHLDGPGEIQHLDMLLAVPEIRAIQWVPLPAAILPGVPGRCQDFADAMSLDIYRRTLAAGKKVVLLGVQPQQVAAIYGAVGADGVYIQTHCDTRADADALIAQAQKEWLRM